MTGTATAAAHRVSSPTRAPRQNNRIIMVCTALFDKDTPQWPFWKFQHLKNTRGVTDFAMLAITRQDSFVATIQNGVASTRTLKRGIKTLDTKLLSGFLDTWYRPNSYFVYGGHGCSDLLEFDDDYRLQVFDLANALGDRQFLGMLFDACVMSSLDTAYYLRKHTKVIGAAEGYMWEEDTWGENHMFNPYAASLMCRDTNSRRVMQLIGEEYTRKSRMADFSVLDTTHAESLWDCVHEKHMERIHASVHLKPEIASGEKPVDRQIYDTKVAPKFDATVPQLPALFATPAVTATGAIVPRDHEHRCNFTFPHALYPEQWDEDHIVDLGAHLKHDAEATELLNKVVVWKSGPSNASLYGVKHLSGMNVSLGQYSYQSANRPLVAHMVPPVADAAARHAKLDTPPLHAAEKRAATEPITTESPTLDVTPTMAPKSTEATAKMDRHADSPRRTEGKGSPTRITSARPAPRRSAPTSPAH